MAKDWKFYEIRRANQVEAELKAAIEAKDFKRFDEIYRNQGMRYLTKKRRSPLYLTALAAHSEEVKKW